MSTASQLTESELRSLRAIRCPEWWQREALSAPQSPIPTASSQQSTLLLRFWRRFFDTHRPPILEGKTVYRHYLNPKAIVAVGESQSFVHLPGVGTRFLGISHQENSVTRKYLLRQLWWTLLAVLGSTHPLKAEKRRSLVLPSCPLPFSVERNFMRSFQVTNDCKTAETVMAP